MIVLVQFEPTGSCNFGRLWKNLHELIYSTRNHVITYTNEIHLRVLKSETVNDRFIPVIPSDLLINRPWRQIPLNEFLQNVNTAVSCTTEERLV